MKLISALFLSLIVVAPTTAQQSKPTLFIGEIRTNDAFLAERYRLLFMEECSKLKAVSVVAKKEDAQFVLEGIGDLKQTFVSGFGGSATGNSAIVGGGSGPVNNAVLSVTVTEKATEKIAFVSNKSTGASGSRGATQTAVMEIMKDLKKRMKWK